jgi:hypothetical protein
MFRQAFNDNGVLSGKELPSPVTRGHGDRGGLDGHGQDMDEHGQVG